MLSQYVNLYFPVCSMITTLVLCIVYFGKKKVKNLDTSIYKALLFTGMIESFFMFLTNLLVCLFFIPENYLIFELLNKLLYSIYIIWLTILFFYLYKLGNNKHSKQMLIFCSVLNIFIMIMIFLSPIELYYENGLTNSSGVASNYLYIGASIYMFMMIIISLIDFKKMSQRKKYIPLVLLLVLMSFMLVIRQFDPLFNISSNILSLVTLVMFFTIENPDLKMVQELEIAKLQAEKSNQAKSDFLSSMSHEIRTPLNAIVGLTDIIKDSEDLNEIHEDAKDVAMASQTLLEIVNGILDISKIEAEKMDLVETEYNLNEILYNLEKMTRNRIMDKEKNIELRCDFAQDLPNVLIGDKIKIQQVITNLLSNAVKYTEEGFIDFKVLCVNDKNQCKLTISVGDTGRGIKKDQIDKLFTKFNRLEEDMNTTIEGTGLGLAITKSLVEMMGGKIVVDSTYGKGSKFTIFISQKISSNDLNENSKISNVNHENTKVLIVDDNQLNIKVASRVLKEFGIESEKSDSGFDCIEKIKNGNKYDIIFMDIMMPKMSGVETLKKLKEIESFKTPVVALTADAMEGKSNKYLEVGFDDYVSKPIDKEKLNIVLNKLLNGDNNNLEENKIEEDPNIHKVTPITDEAIAELNRLFGEPTLISQDEKVDKGNILDTKGNIEYLKENDIDVDSSLELLGDISMYNDTLNTFIEENKTRIPRLEKNKNEGNMKDYSIDVHALKSDSKYLGFKKLAELSYEHEIKSKGNDSEYIESHFEELMNEYERVNKLINEYL